MLCPHSPHSSSWGNKATVYISRASGAYGVPGGEGWGDCRWNPRPFPNCPSESTRRNRAQLWLSGARGFYRIFWPGVCVGEGMFGGSVSLKNGFPSSFFFIKKKRKNRHFPKPSGGASLQIGRARSTLPPHPLLERGLFARGPCLKTASVKARPPKASHSQLSPLTIKQGALLPSRFHVI